MARRMMTRWAALIVVLGLAGPAKAAVVVYTSEAAFSAATTGLTTITFDGIAAAGSAVGYGAGPLALSGVTFTGDGSMFVIDEGYYPTSYSDGGFLSSDFAGDGVNTVVATLPGAATAIGFTFGGLFGPASFTLTLSDGTALGVSSPDSITGTSSLAFFGLTSSTPLTSITFDMPDAPDYNAIDNFRFGAAVVPEPSTLALAGLGGLGLVGVARRRRRAG